MLKKDSVGETVGDLRPAIAFDSSREVSVIIDSLHSYRYNHVPVSDKELDEFIRKLADELEKVLKMFSVKEK
mgnify:CR=1 FL=1|tara:strand:- start:5261 stop:5476 length:216 start_codon:yes stop_codon:yes gene_type:complete